MSVTIDHAHHELIVHGDFPTVREKEEALFRADLLAPGGLGSLSPHRGEDVRLPVAPDVRPEAVHFIFEVSGVEVIDE